MHKGQNFISKHNILIFYSTSLHSKLVFQRVYKGVKICLKLLCSVLLQPHCQTNLVTCRPGKPNPPLMPPDENHQEAHPKLVILEGDIWASIWKP